MSDNVTEKTNGSRSFEERVSARFDAVNEQFERIQGRLGAVEIRIGNLEARQDDTRPIWEEALASIAETNKSMREGFELLRNELRTETHSESLALRSDVRSEIRAEIEGLQTNLSNEIGGLRNEMKSGFAGISREMDRALHGVERKIDVLNHNILDLRAEQLYVDTRLQELESQTKPT